MQLQLALSSPPRSVPTAIEKVKRNEAVSHPKNILVNPGYRIKDYVDPTAKSGVPSFNFGDTPPAKPRLPKKPQQQQVGQL